MDKIAIIGVGLHPFGRFPGKSAIEMGADAIRAALLDAGLQWRDVQFAFGGSYEVDNPDAVVNLLGLTGLPFTDVYNGCATAASAISLAAQTIQLGAYDIGVAVGMDKHPVGAFSADPVQYSLPSWYGELGLFLTPKFFAMKIQRYMYDHGITRQCLAAVAAKAIAPERTVICFAGDGDFLMTGQELATAVQYELPIVVLIVDNGMYGTIRMHQERLFPGRVVGTDLVNPDFAAYAHAFGAYGENVMHTAEFPAALERALDAGRPAVLSLRLDPEAITPRTTLTALRSGR